MTTPHSEEQQATWDTLMVNEVRNDGRARDMCILHVYARIQICFYCVMSLAFFLGEGEQ